MIKDQKRHGKVAIAIAMLLVMTGCTGGISANSKIEQGPVGIGRSINELKGTPCACTEIPMSYPDSMKV